MVLAIFMPPLILQHIEEYTDYGAAVGILQAVFMKPWNKIFAHQALAKAVNNLKKCWMNTFKLWKHLAGIETFKVTFLLNIAKVSKCFYL